MLSAKPQPHCGILNGRAEVIFFFLRGWEHQGTPLRAVSMFLARDGVLALLVVKMEIHGEKAVKMARARIINKLFTIKILYVSFK